jgi:two-component system, OmpR family, sensor histidine kinase BaeS
MRIRLFLSFLLIILITTISIILIARWQTIVDLRNFASRGGFTGMETLVNGLETYYKNNQSWEGVERLFQNLGPQGQGNPNPGLGNRFGNQFQLANAQGYTILDTSRIDYSPANIALLKEEERERAIPLMVNREIVGYLLPETRANLTPNIESSLISLISRGAILAASASGFIALGLSLILGFVLLRPVRALTQAAAALGKGDFAQRVPIEGDDEIATLGQTFNLMAASLQEAETHRRAMTADIAHELRTPLAVQRANLEALQDGIYPLAQENLVPIYEQTRLLERLVEDLRTLALAEAGQIELIKIPTDIPELVQRVVDQFQPHAGVNSQKIIYQHQSACRPLTVDPSRIEQILGNLLTNALRHTPHGGLISVKVECPDEQIQVSVQDTGPGISEDVLPHIFERFYRGDRSRSRTEGGTGLGLSISRRLAHAHGGRLYAENHPEGGAVFVLVLV